MWPMTWAELREKAGNAIYLWLLLYTSTAWRPGEEWGTVGEGNVISDEEVALRMDLTAATVRRYRRALVRCGLLRCGFSRHKSPMWLHTLGPRKPEEKQPPAKLAEQPKWTH